MKLHINFNYNLNFKAGIMLQPISNNYHVVQSIPNEEWSQIVSSLESHNFNEFSEVVKQIDLNRYFDIEGSESLLSAFLLGYFINPDFEDGDLWIREVLAKKPNLDLPMTRNDSLNFKEYLGEVRNEFVAQQIEYPEEAEYINTALSRIDIVLNTL